MLSGDKQFHTLMTRSENKLRLYCARTMALVNLVWVPHCPLVTDAVLILKKINTIYINQYKLLSYNSKLNQNVTDVKTVSKAT